MRDGHGFAVDLRVIAFICLTGDAGEMTGSALREIKYPIYIGVYFASFSYFRLIFALLSYVTFAHFRPLWPQFPPFAGLNSSWKQLHLRAWNEELRLLRSEL